MFATEDCLLWSEGVNVGWSKGDPNPHRIARYSEAEALADALTALQSLESGERRRGAGSVGISAPGRGEGSPRGESSDRISGFKSRSGRAKGGDEVRARSRSLVWRAGRGDGSGGIAISGRLDAEA